MGPRGALLRPGAEGGSTGTNGGRSREGKRATERARAGARRVLRVEDALEGRRAAPLRKRTRTRARTRARGSGGTSWARASSAGERAKASELGKGWIFGGCEGRGLRTLTNHL